VASERLPQRGEIWWVNFSDDPAGSEPARTRPAVVLQNDDLTRLQTAIVMVLSTNLDRARHRGNVLIPAADNGLSKDSVALGHLIIAVDKALFIDYIGAVSGTQMSQIEAAILYILGIPV
jgi:mRNA interferase MazF